MAFQKKGAPSAKSLDLGTEQPQVGDQFCSGNSPVNKQGQVTDKSGTVIDWPQTSAVHDSDMGKTSMYGYDNSQSLDDVKGRSQLSG